MKKLLSVLLVILLAFCSCERKKEKFSRYSFDYFDTASTVTGYEKTEAEFLKVYEKIESRLSEYHKLYDIYNTYPDINNIKTINDNAGIKAVEVDSKIIDLLLYCKEAHEKTEGRTNVMFGSVLSLWHTYRENGQNNPLKASLPPRDELEKRNLYTSIDALEIDKENKTVFIKDENASLDVGATAKGYATEMIARELEKEGVSGYLLNIGGNIRAIGKRGDGEAFKAGVENPDKNNTENTHLAYLELEDMSLVVSGSYQRYYTVDNKEYHHIIDPKTLFPSENYVSVAVVSKSSADADVLSTALFIADIEEGKKLLEKFEGSEAMWLLKSGEKVYSDGFEALTFEYKK